MSHVLLTSVRQLSSLSLAREAETVAQLRGPSLGSLQVGMKRKAYETLKDASQKLATILKARSLGLTASAPRLLFLCGANKSDGATLSTRRQAIIDFLAARHPRIRPIIAERVIENIAERGRNHHSNLFDFEDEISVAADQIVIVLEGYGAFCELGAFSHHEIRKKVVVINDRAFKQTPSFINLGCINAIKQAAGEDRILHYPMAEDGVEHQDSIGTIFPNLDAALTAKSPAPPIALSADRIRQSKRVDSSYLRFIHDLVFLLGKPTYAQLIYVLIETLGDDDYRLPKPALAMLKGVGLIKLQGQRWQCTGDSLFFDYGSVLTDILLSLRLWALRDYYRS